MRIIGTYVICIHSTISLIGSTTNLDEQNVQNIRLKYKRPNANKYQNPVGICTTQHQMLQHRFLMNCICKRENGIYPFFVMQQKAFICT